MKPLGLALGLAAAALIALGLFLGFRTVYDDNGYDCGSAFRENPDLGVAQMTTVFRGGSGDTGCDKERSDALPLPLVVITLGALCGISAAVVTRTQQKQPAPHSAQSAP
jgi:hypothetical protein